jgi:hypothetical protein
LMILLSASWLHILPLCGDTLGSPYHFGVLEELTSKSLRTNMPGNSPLGMANTSPQSAAPL